MVDGRPAARFHKSYTRQLSAWGIPVIYAGVAMEVALTFPRFESRIFPGLDTGALYNAKRRHLEGISWGGAKGPCLG